VDKDTIWEATASKEKAGPDEEPEIPWKSDENRTMRCRRCHLPRVFRRRKTRHSFHFLLSFATLGLWLPVWGVVIILQLLKPWMCSVCGVHQRKS
jgi:hypothetical protein